MQEGLFYLPRFVKKGKIVFFLGGALVADSL